MKKCILIIGLAISLCFVGCGNIKTADKLYDYATERFGKAILTSAEEAEDYTICYLIDEEYDFEYYVKSEFETFNVDGSDFFDISTTESNYSEQFYQSIETLLSEYADSNLNLADRDEMSVEFCGIIDNKGKRIRLAYFNNVPNDSVEAVESFADDYMQYFKELDKHDVFEEVYIDINYSVYTGE